MSIHPGTGIAGIASKIAPQLTHYTRAVIFSGPKYGGLDIPDVYMDQSIGQLTLLVGHLKLHDKMGQQLLLPASQLYVGSAMPVLNLPFSHYNNGWNAHGSLPCGNWLQ